MTDHLERMRALFGREPLTEADRARMARAAEERDRVLAGERQFEAEGRCLECKTTREDRAASIRRGAPEVSCKSSHRTADETLVYGCGVPPRYVDARLDDLHPQNRQSGDTLLAWLNGDMRDSVYLYGPSGNGKTHMAAACCRYVLENRPGKAVRFVTARDWLAEVRAVYQRERDDPDAETEIQVARRYRSPWFLVLNELPRERISGAVAEAVEGLIDYRINTLKPTMVTANLAVADIGAAYNAALASRFGSENFVALEHGGRDLRMGI